MSVTRNSQSGFVTLLAMVSSVVVIGGGTLLGIAAIDSVAKRGCDDATNRWRSGEVYDDIAANREGAIEEAQECKKAIIEATEVAKANAALLGRASNISGSGAELILTEVVNTTMDYVEKASEPKYNPTRENKKPPREIRRAVEEKIKEEKPIERIDKKEEIGEKEEDIEVEEGVEEEEQKEKRVSDKEDDCFFESLEEDSLKVKIICDKEDMGFWYADKNKNIRKVRFRFRMIVPSLSGYQEFEWITRDYSPDKDKVCGFEPAFGESPPETLFKKDETEMHIDIQLIDGAGNLSNVSSCKLW